MGSLKRKVLIMYLITVIGICLYVPWEAQAYENPEKLPAGHTFIWQQPAYLYIYSDGTKILGNEQLSESAVTTGASLTSRLTVVGVDYSKIFFKIVSVTALAGIVLFGGGVKRGRA